MFRIFKGSKSVLFFRNGNFAEPRAARFSDEESVLEVAIKNRVELPHSCGGMGSCGTCRVIVLEPLAGELGHRSDVEREMAQERRFRAEERLACQLRPCDGLKLKIP